MGIKQINTTHEQPLLNRLVLAAVLFNFTRNLMFICSYMTAHLKSGYKKLFIAIMLAQ